MDVTIEKLVYGGDGLARTAADAGGRRRAVFLPFVVEGEQVEAGIVEEKTGYLRAHAGRIIEASPHRVEAGCPYFLRCGGCHYQHIAYEYQLETKAKILKENLARIAKLEVPMEIQRHPSAPWQYRNRTRLKVRATPEFAAGYYRLGSHELLPVEACPISSPLINRAIAALWRMGRASQVPPGVSEIEFFADAEDAQLLVELYCAGTIGDAEVAAWVEGFSAELPEATGVVAFRERADVVEGGAAANLREIGRAGDGELRYRTANDDYRVSAGSFFQVNRYLTDELIQVVCAGQSGGEALELYAGAGLFALPLARQFRHITAVESSQNSFADLRYNAPANLKAVRLTVEHYLVKPSGPKPDLVVVDPPRSGLGERVARALVKLGSPRITYVSCDPATLARDLKVLASGGYRIERAHLLDLFPQTYHMESVFHLTA